ncbi:MAG: glucosamine-6-phosphate isomerase, partial [Bacteroidia bacterium]|nr:glucosamine-6-phosphate isomerase [Bacteroidia bacterium]
MKYQFSKVEQALMKETGFENFSTKIPYIPVKSFPKLGMLSALSFLEWVGENPRGVVSLPTGKTAQYFLRFTQQLLETWDTPKTKEILEKYGLIDVQKPTLNELQFVQTGEFYPINPEQHNSLFNFVNKHYIEGFELDKNRALLINSNEIELAGEKHFSEIFPDYKIDLTLRYREAKTRMEQWQQESIFKIDNWCTRYENQIREKGGIGFFLGGIGPDGHIAFNTRGSDHFSATRLTQTNFETQAITAADLGGIEVSRNRLVITIGLGTIGFNPENKAIIYAAGEAIADVIKNSLENEPSVNFPATSLQKLKNSRFYLTEGAAV